MWGTIGRLIGLGIEFTASIAIGLALGLGFDALFSTKPIGMFMGLGLGIMAAFRTLFKITKNLDEKR
jgi:F0F1-type ATP synthase assembly protein I